MDNKHDQELRTGILEAVDRPDELIERITAYYHDGDRADRTDRAVMYLHMGILAGALARLLHDTEKSS